MLKYQVTALLKGGFLFMFNPDDAYWFSLLKSSDTRNTPNQDDNLTSVKLYKFKASGNVIYHLKIEEYCGKYFFLKFYPAKQQFNENRYKLRTKTQPDFSRIIGTCVKLVQELMKKYPGHVFGFFGQWDEVYINNGNITSQRFDIYKKVTINLFSEEKYKHLIIESLNVLMIVKIDLYTPKFLKQLEKDVLSLLTPMQLTSLIIPTLLDESDSN